MGAYLSGPAKGKKPTNTKKEIRRSLVDSKIRIGNDGRTYGQSFSQLHLKAYGRPPFLEGRNFPQKDGSF